MENAEPIIKLIQETKIPGIAVCTIAQGEVQLPIVYGVADVETQAPVIPETVFEVASLTKPFFARLVLDAIDKGFLKLDQPLCEVAEYGPEAFRQDPNYRLLTAQMILSHRSGLPNAGTEPKCAFTPGTRFGYSGLGYYYLQEVLEKVTGSTLEKLAQKKFDLLGMRQSRFQRPDHGSVAVRHNAEGEKSQPLPTLDSTPNAAFSLHTTASDYARFIADWMQNPNQNDAFHFDDTFTMMNDHWAVDVKVSPDDLQQLSWGLGWGLQKSDEGMIAYHWGDNGDAKAFVAMNITKGTAIVYTANSWNGLAIAEELVTPVVGNMAPALRYLFQKYGFVRHNEPDWEQKFKHPNIEIFGKYELRNEPGWREQLTKNIKQAVAKAEASGDHYFAKQTFVNAVLNLPNITQEYREKILDTKQDETAQSSTEKKL